MTTDSTDEQLFQRFLGGDEDALAALLTRHRGAAGGVVNRRIPNHLRRRVSVHDVLQDAEIALFEGGEAFENRGDGSFKRWYFGIVENKLRETLRRHGGTAKRAAGKEVTRGHRPDTAAFHGQSPSPSEMAVGAEFAEQVRFAMEALPEDYRVVLQLTREAGLTIGEAAEHMGRSREAVKKLYGRAFLRFKQVFDEMYPSPPGSEWQRDP